MAMKQQVTSSIPLWYILAGSLSVKQSKNLFLGITKMWLTVQAHALSKEWIEPHKIATKQACPGPDVAHTVHVSKFPGHGSFALIQKGP